MFFKLSVFKICLFVILFMCGVYALDNWIKLLHPIELKTLDIRFKLRGKRAPGPEVVIIAIDDKSIKNIGRWPWPRSVFANIINILSEAKVIGFDILFTESEEQLEFTRIRKLMARYEDSGLVKVNPGFYKEMIEASNQLDHDRRFAEAIEKNGKVVLPLFFKLGSKKKGNSLEPKGLDNFYLYNGVYSSIGNIKGKSNNFTVQAEEIVPPIYPLTATAKGLGYVNCIPDEDGCLRWETLTIQYAQEYFLPFSVSILGKYLNTNPQQMRINLGNNVELGSLGVYTDESNRFLINYYGPAGTFSYYSFVDVLEGKVSASIFKNKIVLIGSSAAGLTDFWVTPTSPALPGVEKQATIISNILYQDFIIRNKYLILWDLGLILIVGLTLSLFIPKLSPLHATLFSLFLCVLLVAFIQYLFSFSKLWIYVVYPFLTVGFAYSSTTLFRLLTEEREKKRIRGAFKQYLSPVIVDQLVKHPEVLKLGGEKRILTVLFSDIRGFTSLSEGMPPENLVPLLNSYMDTMTEIVLAHGGLLDKYIGDAIMAIYGAPLPQNDHTLKACLTALDMMKELKKLQEKWKKDGLPHLDIGIGINTGPMVVGNMGSRKRFTYTVMGDSVNLASRLEGLNKKYGTNIIISEFTYIEIRDCLDCREIGTVKVRGKKEPVKIHELLGKKV
jgi:adenylate cyclase